MNIRDMGLGGRYNWKNQPERLVYMGHNWSGNGYWHQFSLVDKPGVVWCEVLTEDLKNFERTVVATKKFTAMLRKEGSWGQTPLGAHESTMDLYIDGATGLIEWDIPDLETTEHIGLWFARDVLTEYDGVVSLPKQAIELLREAGFTVDKEFE